MAQKTPITIAYGDGIGPEIMEAVLRILDAANAPIEKEVIEIGEKVYLSGISSGIGPEAWESLRRTRVFLKSPITTPQGGGYKSLNVTTRKALGLYANVRPVRTLEPYVSTKVHMDLVIVRENEEDLYAGIEHQQTSDVVQCLKLISRPGSEKIVRYAFEYAKAYGRKKVSCFTKDNIMKMTDGLFHKVFNEIGEEYPEIEKDHRIIDIGSALLAEQPERFDVIVTENLYGDIISDIAAQVAGSVGLCGSANIGDLCAMFEAIHGSAPDIAGQDIANPSGLLNGAITMLVHINAPDVAATIHNAWLRTLEDGVHTPDVFKASSPHSKVKVGTQGFADAVIERLGKVPLKLSPVEYKSNREATFRSVPLSTYNPVKVLMGSDVFIEYKQRDANKLGAELSKLNGDGLVLTLISNRGVKVWPDGLPETFMTNHFRLRYKSEAHPGEDPIRPEHIIHLLQRLLDAGFDVIKTENLYMFDGVKGYSAGQGE
jgi:isocitrate dehydrogenase